MTILKFGLIVPALAAGIINYVVDGKPLTPQRRELARLGMACAVISIGFALLSLAIGL